jgi:hypothetical protein
MTYRFLQVGGLSNGNPPASAADPYGIMQSNHDVALFFRNRLVRAVGACLQAISPCHPPSPRLRRTGREHLSAEASCEG